MGREMREGEGGVKRDGEGDGEGSVCGEGTGREIGVGRKVSRIGLRLRLICVVNIGTEDIWGGCVLG